MTQFASNLRYKSVIARMEVNGTNVDLILGTLDSKLVHDSVSPDQAAHLIFERCSFILKNQIPLKDLQQEIASKYDELSNKKEVYQYDT